MSPTKSQTAVLMPSVLLKAVDAAVAQGAAESRDRFLITAVENQLAICQDDEIDAAFNLMATDPDYQRETLEIVKEFAVSDWEAFKIAEAGT